MIEIVPFSRSHQAGVIDLILSIQQDECGFPISVEEQPDLLDIPGFYQQGRGGFWVALADGEVVGTIGLRDIGSQKGALRKMFVKASHRGKEPGVASRLVEELISSARNTGVRDVFLGTTEKFVAAHRFYEKNGFVQIRAARHEDVSASARHDKMLDLPATFPRMALDTRFYHRALE